VGEVRLLAAAGAPQGAADAHGVLCALLLADPDLDARAWLEALRDMPGPEPDDELWALHAAARAQFDDDAFDFTPLLPDDDASLAERVLALGKWCQGFLGGLGLGGIDPARLGGDAEEFLSDLAGIAQVVLGSEGGAEEAEQDYAELVEYLRVGVLLVRDALQPPPRENTPG
jgi:uncharacterized protein YgfB (UPF0149 family)